MESQPNKILWITIKSALRQDISSRNLKDPKIRLRAIENLEEQLRNHFPQIYSNPIELLNHDRNEFKRRLGQYKPNGSLSGAEKSIINNIYNYLELYEKDINSEVITKEVDNKKTNTDLVNNIKAIISPYFSFEKLSTELQLLEKLFGGYFTNEILDRIKTIYETTEKFWGDQIENLPKDGIKYLFIAEAPPFSSGEEVTYIYNPNSKPRTLLKALCKAFFDSQLYNSIGIPETLARLTNEGLLVVDSLPFAMDYSSKRGNSLYEEIIGKTVYSYMLPKLNSDDLNWSNNLKVGFGFKRNAIAVISQLDGEFKIDKLNKMIKISNDMITANDAGYPDGKLIKKVFEL